MKVLFSGYSLSQWPLIQQIAKRLLRSHVHVAFASFNADAAVNAALTAGCEALGIRFHSQENMVAQILEQPTTPKARAPKISTPWEPDSTEESYRKLLLAQIQASQTILKLVRPHLVIICEDGPGGNTALIATAKRRGLPTLVVPFGVGEQKDYDNFIEDRAREGSLTLVPDGHIGKALRTFAPRWIRPTVHGDVLIHPAEFILAKVAVGLDLPNPWAVQGGAADLIAVESPAMRRHYLREGIAEDKLRQIGSVYCDAIADVLTQEPKAMNAYRSAGPIEKGRIKLLMALPPSYHGSRRHLAEHASYSDFVRSLVTEAKRIPGIDLSVAVHPSTHASDRQAISEAGARISTGWLLEEIPHCDIFLTTWSSTIRWAIACKKPVLNYDAYGFALPTYQDAGGVATTRSVTELIALLRNLAENPEALRAHAALQAESAPDWGQFDGGDFDRLLLLARELVASRRLSPRRLMAKWKANVQGL